MKKISKSLLLSIIFIIVITTASYAVLDLECVDDTSNILDKKLESFITCANSDLYEKTGVTVTVVTKSSLGGIDIEEYARTYEAEITKESINSDKNIIIVISKNDRISDIYVSNGLSQFITKEDTNKILSSYMVPYFQKSNWNLGVEKGFREIIKLLENHYSIDVMIDTDEIEEMSKEAGFEFSNGIKLLTYSALFVIFFGGLLYTFTHGSSRKAYGVKREGNPYSGYKYKKNSYFGFFPYSEEIESNGKRVEEKNTKKPAKKEKKGISRIVPKSQKAQKSSKVQKAPKEEKKPKGKRIKTRDDDDQLTKDFFDIYKY